MGVDSRLRRASFPALGLAVLCLAVALAACGPRATVPAVPRVAGPLTIDGLSTGFTGDALQVADAGVFLAHDGASIYVHVTAPAGGWISVGFSRVGRGMDGANLILGALTPTGGNTSNDLGRGHGHAPAPEQADYQAVLQTKTEGLTMEFAYPLQFPAGGGFALAGLKPGDEFDLLVAYHRTSAAFTMHTVHGSIKVKLGN